MSGKNDGFIDLEKHHDVLVGIVGALAGLLVVLITVYVVCTIRKRFLQKKSNSTKATRTKDAAKVEKPGNSVAPEPATGDTKGKTTLTAKTGNDNSKPQPPVTIEAATDKPPANGTVKK